MMLTAGRTISSAMTVAVAMASLCVIPLPFMYSMGLGGVATSLMALATSLIARRPYSPCSDGGSTRRPPAGSDPLSGARAQSRRAPGTD